MSEYYHSVTLDKDKCKGCTNCIKRCPTEAIRVRDGKARIIAERCIDCGECILVCPYHAKIAVTDPISSINNYEYKIALPAPALYGQFKSLSDVNKVLYGLRLLGFDHVFEVARGADYVTELIKEQLKQPNRKRPLISSACPATVRLIQVRFPELIDHIVRVESPMEIAAQMAKKEFCNKTGADEDKTGVFFITPCAAKMTSIKNPIGKEKSFVDGTISILDVYGPLSAYIKQPSHVMTINKATSAGVNWAVTNGESKALGIESCLAVDGIQNVIRVLEEIENNKFTDLDFFEGLCCTGGCVGGPLVFENSYVSKNRIRRLSKNIQSEPIEQIDVNKVKASVECYMDKDIMEKPVMKLDDDINIAIQKMEKLETIYRQLPGLDCGSCGSPNCRTLAEDIVRGNAQELDCVFKLREKVKRLAQEMIELAEKMPAIREGDREGDKDNQ